VECEYNLQPQTGVGLNYQQFVSAKSMADNGIPNHKGYFGTAYGSGRAYPDVGHLEFDTAEAVGPASAAVEDITGIERISQIVNKADRAHGGLYRVAGTYIQNGLINEGAMRSSHGRSSGYHENYLIPRTVADDVLMDKLVPTMLATAIWSTSGTLRSNGYVFSQKVWGTGGAPVEKVLARRTEHGNKPMVIVPGTGTDADTMGSNLWARTEVRLADPGHSLVARYLRFAGMSLCLRLIEHSEQLERQRLLDVCLLDPVQSAKTFAQDLSQRSTAAMTWGNVATALDIQEAIFDLVAELDEQVQLPEDEQLAIPAIRGLIDAMRTSKPKNLDYPTLVRARTDFAPRHQFIARGTTGRLNAYNKVAMQRNLLWDRVLPEGKGTVYWQTVTAQDPLGAKVLEMASRSGLAPRARRRAGIVDNAGEETVLNWATYRDSEGTSQSFGNPYGE
jgi:hypothetical protein